MPLSTEPNLGGWLVSASSGDQEGQTEVRVEHQVLPNGEVAADYLPFEVTDSYPMKLDTAFDSDEVRPGEAVEIALTTQGKAKVGLAAVDRSVYVLRDNRLNLRQVFKELKRLNQPPQVEVREERPLRRITTQGAEETFRDAGLIVMTNRTVPGGREHQRRAQQQVSFGFAAARSISYLESQLDDIDDSYTMAIVSYALELGDSSHADAAYDRLVDDGDSRRKRPALGNASASTPTAASPPASASTCPSKNPTSSSRTRPKPPAASATSTPNRR